MNPGLTYTRRQFVRVHSLIVFFRPGWVRTPAQASELAACFYSSNGLHQLMNPLPPKPSFNYRHLRSLW